MAAKTIGPGAEFRLISPKEAAEMLDTNSRNRILRRAKVKEYARDMKLGRWQMTGDAIRFAPGGMLLDGQHRLHACVEAEVAFLTLVLTNVTGQSVMDAGIRRTFADHLSIEGVSHAHAVSAAVRMVTNYDLSKPHDLDPGLRTVTTLADLQATYEKRPNVFTQTVRDGYRLYANSERLVSPGMMSGLYILFRRIDKEVAEWYRLRLYDGNNLKSTDPTWLVRRAFITQGPKTRLTNRQRLALLTMGFNATLKGDEVEHLRWISTGPRAQAFPLVGAT